MVKGRTNNPRKPPDALPILQLAEVRAVRASLTDGRHGIWWAEDAIWDRELSKHAKLVYLYLCRKADRTGASFPSHADVARKTGCSTSSVKSALVELAAALPPLLEIRSGVQHGGSNTYRVLPVDGSPTGDQGSSPVVQGVANRHLPGSQPAPTKEDTGKEDTPKEDTKKDSVVVADATPPWPSPESLAALYNEKKPVACPAVRQLSEGRRRKARALLRQFPDRRFWEGVMDEMRASPLLQGKKNGEGHENWRADFDWLLEAKRGVENAVKVAEGKYREQEKTTPATYGGKFG